MSMSSANPVDAEDILKLFSLYLSEHGEKLLSRAHQFMNVTHIYPYTIPSNNNTKEPLRITHDFLTVCGVDPFLMNDYDSNNQTNSAENSSSTNSSSSSRDTLEVEKSIIERWWERRKKIHSEWVEKYLQSNGTLITEDKSPFALDENPLLTMVSNIYFHHLMNKLRYDSLFGMVNHKVPNSKILKMKYKILRILNARVKEFKRRQKEKKSFFSWFVEQIVDNEFITELTNTDFEKFIYIFKNIRVLQLETNKTKKGPMQSNKTEDVELDLTLFHNLKHLIIRSNFTRLVYIKGKFISNDETTEDSIFKTINLEGVTVLDSQFLRIERNVFHDFSETLRVLNLISIDEQLLYDIFMEDDSSEQKEFSEKSKDVFKVLEILNISNVWFKKGEVPPFFSNPSFIDLLVNKLKVFILKNTNLEISIFDAFNSVGKHFVLSHLMVLNLSHNNLHTILRKKDTEEKNCITINLPNLIELNLAFNELESLDSFHGVVCPKLEIINLEKNQLTQDIAENLRRITANTNTHLKRINLRSNQLTAWQEIKQLQYFNRLHDLQLIGNEEICRYGNYHRTILSYFRRNIIDEFVLDGVKYLKKDIIDLLNLSQTGSSTATDTSSQNGSMSDTDGSDADVENDNFVDLRKQIKKSSSTKSLIQEEAKQVKEEKKKKKKEGKNKKSKKKKKRVFNDIPEYKKDSQSTVSQSNPEEDAKKIKEEFPELEERSSKVIELLGQLRNDGGTKWLSLLNEMGYLDEKNQQIILTPKQNLTEHLKKKNQNKDKEELEEFMNKLKKNSSHNKAMTSLSDFLLGKIKKKNENSTGDQDMVAATPRAKNHQQDFFASMDLARISRLGNKQMPVLEVHPVFGIADTPNFEKYGTSEVSGLSFIKSKGTKYGSDALIAKSLNLEPRSEFLNVSLVVNQSIFKYGEQEKSDTSASDSDKRGRLNRRQRNVKNHYSAKIAELKELEKVDGENSLKISDEEIQNINNNRKRNKGVFLKSELEKTAGDAVGSMINKRATINIIRRKDNVKQPETADKKFAVPIPESNMQKYLNDDDLLESLLNEKNEDAESKKRKESVLRARGRTFISPTSSNLMSSLTTPALGSERDRSATQFNVEPKKEQAAATSNPISLTPIIIPAIVTEAKKESKPVVEQPKKEEPIEEDDDEDEILKELLAMSSKSESPPSPKPKIEKAVLVPPLLINTSPVTIPVKEKTPEAKQKTPEKVNNEHDDVSSALQSAIASSIISTTSTAVEKPAVVEKSNETPTQVSNAANSDSDFDSFEEEETLLPGVTPEKLKLIAPFNDLGQSSDSDFGTYSGDEGTPRGKKSKPSSTPAKQHEKVNSMPIINLASEEPKGRSKSKSVFKIFKKKEPEAAQIKNRISMRIPQEERDFLASTLSGAIEFGPITSSTTFASLKKSGESPKTEPKKDNDSDFDLTDEEEEQAQPVTTLPAKILDESSFETNTPTKEEPETPQISTPIQEEPKVSPIVEDAVSTPDNDAIATSSKKVISNVKKVAATASSPTVVSTSPSTPTTGRKSFVISAKRKKTVAFSEYKQEFTIDPKETPQVVDEPVIISVIPQVDSTAVAAVESYDDEGYGDESTVTPVVVEKIEEPVKVEETPAVVEEPIKMEEPIVVATPKTEENASQPVQDEASVITPPISPLPEEKVIVSSPVKEEPVIAVIPTKSELKAPEIEQPQVIQEDTPNITPETPVLQSLPPPVIIPSMEEIETPESPVITPEPEKQLVIEEPVKEQKPATPVEPIVTALPTVPLTETIVSEIIEESEPVVPVEKSPPFTNPIVSEPPQKSPEPTPTPIVPVMKEEPKQEPEIIPQQVKPIVVKPEIVEPAIAPEIKKPEIVEPIIPISQPIIPVVTSIKEPEKATPKEEIKVVATEKKEIIPEPVIKKPEVVQPVQEVRKEVPKVEKSVVSSTESTTTPSPYKDAAVISPVLIPSPAINYEVDDETDRVLKELLRQQMLNEETEYDDEESTPPPQAVVSTSQIKPPTNSAPVKSSAANDSSSDEEDEVLKSIIKEQQLKTEYDDDDEVDSLLTYYTKQRQQEKKSTDTTAITKQASPEPVSEPASTSPTTTNSTQRVTKARRNAIGSSSTTIPSTSRKRSTAVVIPSQRRQTKIVKTVDDLLLDDSDNE